MTECNSVECNSYETYNIYLNLNATPLSDQQQFRLDKINEFKDYFVAEIKDLVSIALFLTIFISH